MNESTSNSATAAALAVGLLGCAALVWTYGATLQELARVWSSDPEYSHGYLVPAFSAYLLWRRRTLLADRRLAPSAWGLLLLGAGTLLRLAAAYSYFDWLDAASAIICLGGLCLLAGGWPAARWAWPAVAFLVFMIPLPYRLEIALAQPLQRLATVASTFVLQTLGFPALAEGNTIRLNEIQIGIVEACSGLRMLMTFFAIATAVILVARLEIWQRLAIVASAIPIALAANMVRITATGVLHDVAGSELANLVFHDVAGWLMMPLAVGLLWLELLFLTNLFIARGGYAGPVPLRG